MRRKKNQVMFDTVILLCSIVFAAVILTTGITNEFLAPVPEWRYLSFFLAGTFFTSMFTTAPAAAILAELAEHNSLMAVAFWGGLGAALGDYIIFHFIKDRIAEDVRFLLGRSTIKRLSAVFTTGLSRWVMPLIGALIVVSPLPDEIGLAILGVSKMKDRVFLPLAFVLNAAGIAALVLIAQSLR